MRLLRVTTGLGSLAYLTLALIDFFRVEQSLPRTLAVVLLAAGFCGVTVQAYFRSQWSPDLYPDQPGHPLTRQAERLMWIRAVVTTLLVLLWRPFDALGLWILGQSIAVKRGLRGWWTFYLLGLGLFAYGQGALDPPVTVSQLSTFAGRVGMWLALLTLLFFFVRDSVTRDGLLAQLRVAHEELRRRNEVDAENAALRERTRLARDVHDLMGRSLVQLSVQLEVALRLTEKRPSQVAPVLAGALGGVRESMRELRRSLQGLRDSALDGRELEEAVVELLRSESSVGSLQLRWEVAGDLKLPPGVQDVLWRVLQEALNNVRKHAQATSVNVELRRTPQEVLLRVTDDGVGPETPQDVQAQLGFGLRGMRERCESCQGELRLLRAPAGGTVLEARLPLKEA